MIKFKTDKNLGQVVENPKVFSFGAFPIKDIKEIEFAAGGKKFSQLCGFRFTSKVAKEGKDFFVSFVCKLQSIKKHENYSHWYVYQKKSANEYVCLSKADTLKIFNFDIDKFFDSDFFTSTLTKFKSAISTGLETYIPKFAAEHGNDTIMQGSDKKVKFVIARYSTAIQRSLKNIDKTEHSNNPTYVLKLNEDAILSEKTFECVVKNENGKYAVYEKDGNIWVATFANKTGAYEFAEEYPKLKEKYLKDDEQKDKMVEKEPEAKKDIFEEELNRDIEEALKEIYK